MRELFSQLNIERRRAYHFGLWLEPVDPALQDLYEKNFGFRPAGDIRKILFHIPLVVADVRLRPKADIRGTGAIGCRLRLTLASELFMEDEERQ